MTARRFGVVPAAGSGTRLLPYRAAKELIQVGYRTVDGRPLPKAAIEHVLLAMRTGGVDNVLLVLSPDKGDVFRYLGAGQQLGLDLAYLCQERPLGLPDALNLATPYLGDETVCMGLPDTMCTPADCFAQLFDFHEAQRADLSLGVFPTGQPQALAPVVVEPRSHRVLAVVDKPEHPPVSNTWGIAVWSPAFTRLLQEFVANTAEPRGESLLSDVFATAVTAGLRVRALTFDAGEYHDIGTPDGVVRARQWLESEAGVLTGPRV
ncbi:sugar phosphate nucleotidyltransferase [Solwaraspora sp. WMMB335]|uniref:sugar phosphate nucleotidyltransferase n=1 Tax=Solwaraspora sp. WMMB335 TaxID=3404118 RepID=UPI003B926E4D